LIVGGAWSTGPEGTPILVRAVANPALSPLRLIRGQAGVPSPPASEADADLLRAVRAADTKAAATFHDRVRPVVGRTLTRLLGARDPDLEDLTQQALIDLVLSLERFRGDCPLDAWAAVIAARAAYKHIRRRKIERRLFVLENREPERVDRAAAGAALVRNSIRRVERHLEGIEQKQAWTFVLHDVHGFSLKEISDITKVSVAAVQSRLVRGRKELHDRIRNDPELAGVMDDFARSHREVHD
jgi:RNA polymerase sigma factor (sigma-70 family)